MLIICSCKKDSVTQTYFSKLPETNYSYLDTSIYHYKFKPGSYWVYENDSTGTLDSIVVDSVSEGYYTTIPSVHGTTSETKSAFYKMNMHNYGTLEYFNETLIESRIERNYSGDWTYGQPVYFANSPTGTSNHGLTVIAKSLMMTVNSNNFNRVNKMQILQLLSTNLNLLMTHTFITLTR